MKPLQKSFSLVFNLSIVLVIGFLVFKFFAPGNQAVTREEFNEKHTEVLIQFDSLKRHVLKIDKDIAKLSTKVDSIRLDIDTLKAGQQVIYSEVRKTPKDFKSELYQYLFN